MTISITRANVEEFLDSGKLYAAMRSGRWWKLRRNGKTQRWVRDASRIRIPVKAGLRATTAITEDSFAEGSFSGNWRDEILRIDEFRHVDDVPADLRS